MEQLIKRNKQIAKNCLIKKKLNKNVHIKNININWLCFFDKI